MARKVVGVGSVGTRAFIVLLQGRDQHDPLFLQVKEATRSVLEGPLPKSRYKEHGERVVTASGCCRPPATSSWAGSGHRRHPLLLLAPAARHEGLGRGRVDDPGRPRVLCRICGWTLARAHARSGDPSRSPPTSAKMTSSTGRSATSPNAMPTRTSRTTRHSPARSTPDDYRYLKASSGWSGLAAGWCGDRLLVLADQPTQPANARRAWPLPPAPASGLPGDGRDLAGEPIHLPIATPVRRRRVRAGCFIRRPARPDPGSGTRSGWRTPGLDPADQPTQLAHRAFQQVGVGRVDRRAGISEAPRATKLLWLFRARANPRMTAACGAVPKRGTELDR